MPFFFPPRLASARCAPFLLVLVLICVSLVAASSSLSLSADRSSASGTASSEASSEAPLACMPWDYVPTYSTCFSNATRLRDWTTGADARCAGNSTTVPPAAFVPCASCPTGMRGSGSTLASIGDCAGCPAGERWVNTTETASCEVCPPGMSATPVLAIRDGFGSLSGNLSSLAGMNLSRLVCPTTGAASCTWEMGVGFEVASYTASREGASLTTGVRPSHARPGTYTQLAVLGYAFTARSAGYVEVTFAVQNFSDNGASVAVEELGADSVVVLLDGSFHSVPRAAQAAGNESREYRAVFPFHHPREGDAVSHSFSWQVTPNASSGVDSNAVTLLSLVVHGDAAGGVEACEPCPAGHACPLRSTAPSACLPGTYQPATHAQRCLVCDGDTIAPGYGFHACLPCAAGTVANADHTACSPTCVYDLDGDVYNFTALAGVVLNASVDTSAAAEAAMDLSVAEADAAAVDRIYVSLCGALPIPRLDSDAGASRSSGDSDGAAADSVCVADVWGHNSSTSALMCERVTATQGRHFGNVVQLTRNDGRVELTTSMGSLLTPVDGAADATTSSEPTAGATIVLECAADTEEQERGQTRVVENATDRLTVTWRSPLACAQCTERSFTNEPSKCNSSFKQTIGYTKKENSTCIGGFAPPPAEVVSCVPCVQAYYTLEWQGCDATTRTEVGVYVLQQNAPNCTPYTRWEPTNQTRACKPASGSTGRGTAKVLSAMVGISIVVGAGFLAAKALSQHRQASAGSPNLFAETGTELSTMGGYGGAPSELEAHYNVVDPGFSNSYPAPERESRLSNLTGRMLSSLTNGFRRANAAVFGARSASTGEVDAGGDYSSLPTGDNIFQTEEEGHPPSRSSHTRRGQMLFSLNDDDNDDVLPRY